VNEATIKTYGYHDAADAVGKSFSFGGNEGTIIGVVKDFHYNSLQYKVEPTCMSLLHNSFSRITVRFSGGIQESVAIATDAWKKHFPNSVMDFEFAEDALNSQYRSELRFSKVFIVFSAISLAIAGLGLFALVSYTVESRTKEIGIRKVLGASVSGIFSMLSKEFLLLIVIASVIAVPVGYYLMKQWLLEFAYRIELTPAVFLMAGLLVLLIAWLTVSLRTIKAAMSNPVEALRTE
jgi:putative ABC transport system permease protein